jgi:hypothetical protein
MQAALGEMQRQVGDLQIHGEGLAVRGLLVRSNMDYYLYHRATYQKDDFLSILSWKATDAFSVKLIVV